MPCPPAAGDVTLVPVPGHTPGQLAVIVEDDNHSVFLVLPHSFDPGSVLINRRRQLT
jgi:hypothetical protein